MTEVVTSLTAGITPTVIMGQVGSLVPFLVIIVPTALGLYFLRKLVKGAAKGKVRF
jgi:hypothetical protein